MRKAARIDDSQVGIVAGLRQVGASVQSLAAIGKGCPDILCGFRGKWYIAELKDGQKSLSRQKLTTAEQVWHESARAPVHIWTSLDEALKTIIDDDVEDLQRRKENALRILHSQDK